MKKTVSLPVYDEKGKKVEDLDLTIEEKKDLDVGGTAHQVIRSYMANARSGTASTKTRSEVRGGGAKPWRQKGTGRARIGSIRAPHWTGGGTVFGPHPRDFSFSIPKKMKKNLLSQLILKKFEDGKLRVVKKTGVSEGRTAEAVKFLGDMKLEGKTTIVVSDENTELEKRAFRNLKNVREVSSSELNIFDIYWGNNLLLHEKAVEALKARLI